MKEKKIVVDKIEKQDTSDKKDCFAWRSKVKCNALKIKDCKDCSFYKSTKK